MEKLLAFTIGLLIFVVLSAIVSIVLMPDYGDSARTRKWKKYPFTFAIGLIIIFSVFVAHYAYHQNEQAKVKRAMQEAKAVAVITCLEKRYHIKHLIFGIFEYEKTGETFQLTANTWETCQDAN